MARRAGTTRAIRRARQCHPCHHVRPARHLPSRSTARADLTGTGTPTATTGGGHAMAMTGSISTSNDRQAPCLSGARRSTAPQSSTLEYDGETKPPRSSGDGNALRGLSNRLRQRSLRDARRGSAAHSAPAASKAAIVGLLAGYRNGAVANMFSARPKPQAGLGIAPAAAQAAMRARSALSLRPAAFSTPLAPSSAPGASSSARKRSRS